MNEWLTIAQHDWVQIGDYGRVLHAVDHLDNAESVDDDWVGYGVTACGQRGTLVIPGIFSRMEERRCRRCCDLTGMPRGVGSPKNDAACKVAIDG